MKHEKAPTGDSKSGFESTEIPTEQVEDVVVALDEAFSHCRLHPEDPICSCSDLHHRICHTEVKGIFEHYERHEILIIDDINGVLLRPFNLLRQN